MQAELNNGKLSVESVPAAFREMCQAAVLHWWSSNRQQALYTNKLLNFGNQHFEASTPSQSISAGTESAAADSFWLAAPVFDNLLAFNYPVSALPANFQVGVQRPTHRKIDGQKRQQPDSAGMTYQHPKKSKPGSSRQALRQQGDHKGRMAHMPELSPKLQKRLATLLVLITADAEPDASGLKQACAFHPAADSLCTALVSAALVAFSLMLQSSHAVFSLHHSKQYNIVPQLLYCCCLAATRSQAV